MPTVKHGTTNNLVGSTTLHVVVRNICLVNILLHFVFLGLEIYSLHYYGIMGSVLAISSCFILLYANYKVVPHLYLPYMFFTSLFITAWIAAGSYVVFQGSDHVNELKSVHTLLKWQTGQIAIILGSMEIAVSLLQIVGVVIVYKEFIQLRKINKG